MCTTCEQIFGTLHLVLSNKEAKTEVLNELTALCKQYAGTSEVVCVHSNIHLCVNKSNSKH